jgi:hypothetical protein
MHFVDGRLWGQPAAVTLDLLVLLIDKALQQRWRIPNIWLPTSLVLVKWIMRACERAVDHGHLHPHESCLGQRILYGTPANGVTGVSRCAGRPCRSDEDPALVLPADVNLELAGAARVLAEFQRELDRRERPMVPTGRPWRS